ncbi:MULTISPECIES: WhiB family transcriptional regulator [Streptomyces]|uniref:WhiB family transcriptional regulator n=1 Tax=Streptomyces TaxID=1883 RepID=UPI00068F3841|nr:MULTISPECIES: WhiB family transcriptional regulator [Streptomyces]
MIQLHTIISGATRTPHRTARPAATVLAEYRPDGDGDLRGAACTGSDTNLFYPDPEEMGPETAEWAERRAKMMCAGCPVKSMCLADALERKEPHGIFGGLNERERNSLLRRAARDRARVNAGGAG